MMFVVMPKKVSPIMDWSRARERGVRTWCGERWRKREKVYARKGLRGEKEKKRDREKERV